MTITLSAEIEQMLRELMSSGKYASESEVVKDALSTLKDRGNASGQVDVPERKPEDLSAYLKELSNMMKDVPEEEFVRWPVDGSEQHDHYIYGTPKKS